MMVGLEAVLTNWSQLLSATHYCFLQLQLYQFHNNQKNMKGVNFSFTIILSIKAELSFAAVELKMSTS